MAVVFLLSYLLGTASIIAQPALAAESNFSVINIWTRISNLLGGFGKVFSPNLKPQKELTPSPTPIQTPSPPPQTKPVDAAVLGITSGENNANFASVGENIPGLGFFTTVTSYGDAKLASSDRSNIVLGNGGGKFSLSSSALKISDTGVITGAKISASSNTVSNITNSNLSGSAAISNANLENSSITISTGTGLSGGGGVSLGSSITLTNSGVTSLSGTANQISASSSTGAVTLSLPQSIGTSSSPTFSTLNLSGTTNQLVLGTTNTITITSTAPASSKIATIPNLTSDDEFVFKNQSQSLTNKTISAASNTISNLTNSNLSGSASITNANLANSTITFAGDSSSSTTALGATRTVAGAGIITTAVSGGTLTVTGTEADTLSSVTGRGASTSTQVALNGGLTTSSINGLTITTTTGTLTLANGKTLTANNSLTFAGTDGTTFTLPTSSDDVVGRTVTQTLTNKTIAAGSNTISGLTNANLSGTAAISNANLANSSITVNAGTGLSGGGSTSLGSSVTLTNAGVTSLTGTTNQINVSASTGSVTVSLPQDVATSSTPTFAGLSLTGGSANINIGSSAYTGNINIGSTASNLALNDGQWSISGLGAANFASISGAGLSNCSSSSSKLLWSSASSNFSCGTDRASITIRKSADESVVSSITLQNDDHLTFAIGASETWIVEFVLFTNAPAAPDIKVALTAPAGATCVVGAGDWANISAGSGNAGCGTAIAVTSGSPIEKMVVVAGTVVNSTTAGNITLQWAQNTSSATATTVRTGSYVVGYKVSGADLAEVYYTNDGSIEPGDVVAIDPTSIAGVKKAAKAYDENAIGIISTKPGLVLGENASILGKPVLLGLSGRVPIKVTTQNGPIQAGDYLTSSDIPGVAMKATRMGPTIGRALDSYSSEGVGRIVAFINLTYADPTKVFANLAINEYGLLTTVQPQIATQSASLAKKPPQPKLDLKTELASFSARLAKLEALSSIIASPSAKIEEASFSATPLLESILQMSKNAQTEKINTAAYFEEATVSGKFKSLGQTVLGQTLVAGDFTQDGTFSINGGNSVNAYPILFFQNSPLAKAIDFFNSKVTFSSEGKIKTEKIGLGSKAAGKAVLAANQTSISIVNADVNGSSLIFITAQSPTGGQALFVSSQESGKGFTVSLDHSYSSDIKFNWMVVEGQ